MKRLGSICMAACVVTGALASSAFGAAHAFTKEEQAVLDQAQIMSKAFAIVSRKIRASVVHIVVERVSGGGQGQSMETELMRRFFPRLRAPQRRSIGQGSGVLVDGEGHILTNHHVVDGATALMVKLHDGRELPAELVGSDPDSDIAVIRIQSDHLTPAPLGDSDEIEVGEWVLAVGSPFGLESSISAGIISARGRSGVGIVEYEDFIQTDTAINPGNSGGPLINLRGEVIGINNAIFSKSGGSQGIGFSIPINLARNILNEIVQNKHVTRSFLGVTLQKLTPELAQAFRLEAARGALVNSVHKDTPAAKAGLQRGDVILRLGKRVIQDDEHLRNLIATTAPGETVELLIARGGARLTKSVTLQRIPEQVVMENASLKVLTELGLELAELTDELREKLGYESNAWGVIVTTVRRGSVGAQMGLRPGSLLLKINGNEVRTPADAQQAMVTAVEAGNMDLIWRWGRWFRRYYLQFEK